MPLPGGRFPTSARACPNVQHRSGLARNTPCPYEGFDDVIEQPAQRRPAERLYNAHNGDAMAPALADVALCGFSQCRSTQSAYWIVEARNNRGGSGDSTRDTVSPGNASVNYGYFDANYLRMESRQHLGVDLRASADTIVLSHVRGEVITNRTDRSVDQAYLVIRASNGDEHVFGHISSNLRVGAEVRAGQEIGRVRDWGRNSHLHWGVNGSGVSQAVQGDWGWGRAPANATREDASRRGWRRP